MASLHAGNAVESRRLWTTPLSTGRPGHDREQVPFSHGDGMGTNTTGIWTTRQLTEVGVGQAAVRRHLANGTLERLRRGWYAEPWADDALRRAVRARGCLGCTSALARHGVWVPEGPEVHVRREHREQGPLPVGLRSCPATAGPDAAPGEAVDDPLTALRSAWRCVTRDEFVAIVDSAVHLGIVSMVDVRAAFGAVRGAERVLDRCDVAESGSESLVRLRLRRRKVRVRPQVWLGSYRVDLLVGERLVIEVDSRAHHTGEEHYRSDRERDLALRRMGYIVVRLTYAQVVHHWDEVEPALMTMIRRGDQWWRGQPGRGVRRGLRPSPTNRPATGGWVHN